MFLKALPFWLSVTFVPLLALAAVLGEAWALLIPVYGWLVMSVLDAFAGLNEANEDTETPSAELFWYKLVTWVWLPIQLVLIFGLIVAGTRFDHLGGAELALLTFAVGTVTGTIGINYAHELMHQKNRYERALGEWLMTSVLYGHFVSEHLLVHHRYVGTPRDPVTARYNEGFHRFFPRVLWSCVVSSFAAERARLAKKGLPVWHRSNPFWRYWGGGLGFMAVAFAIGGWLGVLVFVGQAFVAVWLLELVNYVEHYGLTRRHLGEGRYEHVQPRHSWNAAHRVTNWMLINLQRHSDHHYKPDRRFPLLQTYPAEEAPQLPFAYPIMTALAMVPPLYRRVMNPRVRKWRADFYPDIEDWTPYKTGATPMPR